jgi:peroxiredoxin
VSEERYLEAALRLGVEIAAAAIWSDERCTWVGASPEEAPGGALAVAYASFGPDLYGGTAGVGLVLAELFDAGGSDEPELRRAALGALDHALGRADEVPEPARLGAYGGRLGIALAAARAGRVLGEPELVARAGELVGGLDYEAEPLEHDLLGGRAGGILALLALHELAVEGATLERAVALGDGLVAAAERDRTGWSWPSLAAPEDRNLTGLSHGTAGIGLALLELERAGGGARFGAAAEAAFAYERSLYDARARNWPDLRAFALQGRPADAAPPCSTLWCHGAPGIALSRLRACELGDSDGCEEEARRALATTAESLGHQLGAGNYSLCHGLTGNAEVLAEGAGLLGEEPAIVREVADAGLENHLEAVVPWPLGVQDGQTDGLLVGRAGTAYFYLRLHDPRRPSLLLLRPESFASATMSGLSDYTSLPDDLPAPADDGAADHLPDAPLPHLALPATSGGEVDVAELATGLLVAYVYPRTGVPGEPLPEGWDDIPGARGCTPQSCSYRDSLAAFGRHGVSLVGISAQSEAEQAEFAAREHIAYPLLADPGLRLAAALHLPTFEVEIGGEAVTLYRRLTFVAEAGLIVKAFYPVFPPDRDAATVLAWLDAR